MMSSRFLNTDLEIESRSNLTVLAKELGDTVSVLYSGPMKKGFLLSIENFAYHRDADKTIHALCSIVEKLSTKGKRLWASSRRKEFNLGFDVSMAGHSFCFALRNDTLRRVADLGATLGITIYPEANPGSEISTKDVATKKPLKQRQEKRRLAKL